VRFFLFLPVLVFLANPSAFKPDEVLKALDNIPPDVLVKFVMVLLVFIFVLIFFFFIYRGVFELLRWLLTMRRCKELNWTELPASEREE